MTTNGDPVAREVLRRTKGLKPNQRLIMQLYAVMPKEFTGAVKQTATSLAGELGMTPTLFSRVRGQLAKEGWLEEVDRISNSPIFRLGEKATGERTVIPLRSA
ncbi:replication initiation protein, RepL2 [Streptomyces sp. NPDC006692]|uniref:replication initiation protein, RepL2 n=1 Tax=unclassified Streptomyces TaxID=2593676 RepID=UPI002B97EDD3|nr:replication initiation protein, RepL2 [Streptomyces sp.]HWU11007.1 replication initiation protein, RepL2 [Streptomyces sp.]